MKRLSCMLLAVLLAACGSAVRETVRPAPRLDGSAPPAKYALHVGVYYSPQFLEAEFKRGSRIEAGFLDQRARINTRLDVPLGRGGYFLYNDLLERLFARVTRVDDVTEVALARHGVDLLVVPSLEHFDLPLSVGPAWTPPVLFETYRPAEHAVAYRTTLYSRSGVPLASWVVSGSADRAGVASTEELVNAYMNDAAQKLRAGFEREAAAVLAAAKAPPRPAGEASEVTLAARVEAMPGVDAWQSALLRRRGILCLSVTARNPLERTLLVRASDLRLRLPGGQILEPAPLSSVIGVSQRVTAELAAQRKPAPLEGLSNALNAMVNPVGHVVGDAVFGNLLRGQEGDDQQKAYYLALTPALFGERSLARGREEKGFVFFPLPYPVRSGELSLTAWIVDLAALDGVQVLVPVADPP